MLFEPVMQQSYLLNEFDISYQPLAALQPGAPIEFFVKNSSQLYLDLNNTRLNVEVQILKDDNTKIPSDVANAHTAPANLLLHTLFKEVTVQLNGKTVTDPSNMYGYRAYLETLVNFNSDTQKYRLITEGWDKDTGSRMDRIDDENKGAQRRVKMAADSPIFELTGRPHLDLFQQTKLIPPGVDLHIKFVPHDDKFMLMCTDAAFKPKVKISNMCLTVRKKQLTDAAEVAHRQLVLEQNYRIPYTRVLMKHLAITAGSTTMTLDNLFTGPLPDLVLCGFVDDEAFAGSYATNPYNFKHFGIRRMDMYRNGTKTPRYGYSPTFSRGFYHKEYLQFQEQLGYEVGDKCVTITPAEWGDGYTLYAFKLTDGPIGSGTAGPRSRSNTGNARLEFDFVTAPTANIKLVIMYQSLAVMEIDQFNNIIIS